MSQNRRPSSQNRPTVSRPGSTGLRFGMFAVCVTRDSDPGLNSGKGKPLYDLLVSYADVSSRDTGQGYPYREALASCLDCSKQTVDRAAEYLEKEIGLVTIHRRKVEGKPDENDANLYEIHDAWLIHGVTPPADTPAQLVARYGHTVPGLDVDAWVGEHAPGFDLAAWRAAYDAKLREQAAKREEQRRKERARRKKSKKGGGVTDDATPEGVEERGGGVMGDALSRAGFSDPALPDDDGPSGRSPGGCRRPPTGSKGAEGASGSAASGNDSPAPGSEEGARSGKKGVSGTRLTKEQRQVRNEVMSLLPPDLRQAIGDIIPTNVGQSIIAALADGQPRSRTPQQLVKYRLMPRWNGFWSQKFYAGELTPDLGRGKRKKPFGPLMRMLADTAECGNLWCEDRHDFVIAGACQQCEMRKVDNRADRARERQANAGSAGAGAPEQPPVPVQRSAPRHCAKCETQFAKHADPAQTVCRDCLAKAAAAELDKDQATPDMRPPAEAAAHEEFTAEVSADEQAALAAEEQRIREEAELDARLRAQIAAQIGTPEQVAAYCNSAPF